MRNSYIIVAVFLMERKPKMRYFVLEKEVTEKELKLFYGQSYDILEGKTYEEYKECLLKKGILTAEGKL